MKYNQFSKKQKRTRIENTHHNQRDFKKILKVICCIVEFDVHLNQFFTRCIDIVNNESICNIVYQTHPEYPNDEFEKMIIVLVTYAIIQVLTMVIEARSAAVTLATMFGA